MQKFLFFLVSVFLATNILAQNLGDTIIVKSFNYSQTYGVNQWSPGIRDTMIGFPNNPNLTFEKILMLYNIRCKGAKVSPAVSGQTDIGCGEWDASCNTYITDSSRIDSVLSFTDSHWISNFSSSSFSYTSSQMNDFYRYFQKNVSLDSTLSETSAVIGAGIINNPIFTASTFQAKNQFLFTQNELLNAGLTAGNINGLTLMVNSGNDGIRFLRIRLRHITDSVLDISNPNLTGFSEVFFHDFNFSNGANRIQFYSPFLWDGISNIIVEYSFSNNNPYLGTMFQSDTTNFVSALKTHDDNSFLFDGSNYIKANQYKGISGAQPRTVEAWIKTNIKGMDIVSWGSNNTGKKWIFKLNPTGNIRVEVNGGYSSGNTVLTDNQWHHVAVVMNGNSVNNLQFYVDGILETNLTVSNYAINTDSLIDVVISQGFHSRFWNGNIDEVRIWSAALPQNTIRQWMYGDVDSSHSNYSNLELYYKFDENQGSIIHDYSGKSRHASVYNLSTWSKVNGVDLFKSLKHGNIRPKTSFIQGNYLMTILNDTVLDTVLRVGNYVKAYQIVNNAGTYNSDLVQNIYDTIYWKSGYEYIIDPISSAKIDSIFRVNDGIINISQLNYFKRYPAKYEIMSFVTPYGINLDLGPTGKTWTFDVTDFGPILKGNKRMTVERGGQWMEDMDIKFLFIVGTPPQPILDINQLWKVDSYSYTNIMTDKVFEPRNIKLSALGKSFKVRSVITGHGQEGEFIPQNHLLNINGGTVEFTWPVWKSCSDNPIYPQGGTWIYDRAGWCPGAPTNIKEMDITSFVNSGQTHEIDYSVTSASGTSNYIVSNQLVTYGNPSFVLDAAIIDITGPTNKVEHARENMICNSPSIIIQNTGSTNLTTLKIKYWVNNNAKYNTYNWSGNLSFLEKTEVILPADSALWSGINPTNNYFNVEIENPNGGQDQYSFNNHYRSDFKLPTVVSSDFIIALYTNKAPSETSYKLYDDAGNILFHKTGLASQKLYRDTFNLAIGCYKIELLDSDGDGLSFFANSDGSGSFNIRHLNNSIIKAFNPDFGSKLIFNFTIDFPLSYDEIHLSSQSKIFPNPNNGKFYIDFGSFKPSSILVFDAMGKLITTEMLVQDQLKNYTIDLSSQTPGLYIIKLQNSNEIQQLKVLIQP
jgi:hypothetical protein